MVLDDGRERLVGDAPHQQDLGRCQMLIHPTLEFGAGVAEVSRRPFAGGVPVERDEQVRDELSHIDPFLVPSSGLPRTLLPRCWVARGLCTQALSSKM